MNSKLSQPWLPAEKIESLVQLEPVLVLISLALFAWLFYHVLLKRVSEDRHRALARHFKNLSFHLAASNCFFLGYYFLSWSQGEEPSLLVARITTYLGFISILWMSVTFVKVSRILVLQYLFWRHMRTGVPLLVVNIFTLLLSILTGAWLLTELFSLKVGPLLATSAFFTVVLGIAMQETLGNLFSGIAIQFDKPYEIGDWIEVSSGTQKWIGQVYEVTWRATILVGWGDELVTIPNRVMGQSQISNYAAKERPIIRSHLFRVPHGTHPDSVKHALSQAVQGVDGIAIFPPPLAVLSEIAESYLIFKIIYAIKDYGGQVRIGDKVMANCLEALSAEKIQLAEPVMRIKEARANVA